MTATFFFLQHIDRSLKVIVRSDSTRMYNYHTALNFSLIDTTEQQTYVVTSLTFSQVLAEHFHTGDNRFLIFTKTEQLNFVTNLTNTRLNTTRSNSTTASDREHILYRHQERFIHFTCWLLNPSINSVHQLHYRVNPLLNTIQSTECRTTDDRSIFFVTILLKDFTNLHFNEIQHLLVVNHITLVQEYNQAGYVHLTSQEHVLTCLRHRTICSSNYQDSTIHLSSTSNHVLDIVSVTRTVYVCIVAVSRFIFNVSRVDCDTTLFFFRSVINLIERLDFLCTEALLVKNFRDSSSQSCLTMVNVTNCTNVNVRFGTYEFFLSHSFLFLFI